MKISNTILIVLGVLAAVKVVAAIVMRIVKKKNPDMQFPNHKQF